MPALSSHLPTTFKLTANDVDAAMAEDAAEALAKKMKAEYTAFENGLPVRLVEPRMFTHKFRDHPVFPHPATAGGLPVGWNIRWCALHPTTDNAEGGGLEVYLIERETGGWGLVFHSPDLTYGRNEENIPTSTLWMHTAPTLAGLYAHAVTMADANLDIGGPEADLRGFVLTRYDMEDPVEAAEAVLVGLGAHVTVFPRALAEQ